MHGDEPARSPAESAAWRTRRFGRLRHQVDQQAAGRQRGRGGGFMKSMGQLLRRVGMGSLALRIPSGYGVILPARLAQKEQRARSSGSTCSKWCGHAGGPVPQNEVNLFMASRHASHVLRQRGRHGVRFWVDEMVGTVEVEFSSAASSDERPPRRFRRT
jgi:hypothetical protein